MSEEYLREVFGYFADASGKVSPAELVSLVRALGRNPSEAELREINRETIADPSTTTAPSAVAVQHPSRPSTSLAPPPSSSSLLQPSSATSLTLLRPSTPAVGAPLQLLSARGGRPLTSAAQQEITFDRFLRIWRRLEANAEAKRETRARETAATLSVFNRDGRGRVWLRDLTNVLGVVGSALSPEEIERLEADLAPYCPALTVAGGGGDLQASTTAAGATRDPWLPMNDFVDLMLLPQY